MAIIFSILTFALMVGALIDIIRRDDSQIKHLPKLFWVILVILLPLVGAVLWFLLGRDYASEGVVIPRMRRERPAPPQSTSPLPPADSRTTEQQIADLDREIEEWRLRQEIEKRRREGGESPAGSEPAAG